MKKLTILLFLILIASISRAAEVSEVLLVEFSQPPSATQINLLKQIKSVKYFDRLTPYNSDYFNRMYEVRIDTTSMNKSDLEILKQRIFQTGGIKKVFESLNFSSMSIIPSTTTTPASNDKLFNYQWNLHNNGQKVLNDITDIRPEVLEGKDGIDLGWVKVKDQLNTIVKRDVRVAVIDSGSTIDHPDLRNSFHRNMIECTPQGTPNAQATEDKDNNGYIGDCVGWSFATPDNQPKGSRIVIDDFGHGTHVGAIMAADSSNTEGIAGISSKIKLIPIKVYRNDEIQVGQMRTLAGFISNITKAVTFAIAAKAEVINISLGWPESADSDDVRNAFAEAMAKGITVVAAAGNDANNALIYPCAYKGVICVGAASNDGSVSDFSNFGGHVDILAPGNEILSAIPVKIRSEFSIAGYDIKWGTSQASPHVAAVVALLKGAKENISADEIYARIMGSTTPLNEEEKYFLGGLIQLDKSLMDAVKPVVRPVFKDISQIPYHFVNADEGRFELKVPLKNYGAGAQNVEVVVSGNLPNMKFDAPITRFPSLSTSQETVIKVSGSIRDLKSESNLTLNIQIKGSNFVGGNYKHNLFLTRALANDPEIRAYPIVGNNTTLDIVKVSNLTTVQTYTNRYPTPEYLSKEPLPAPKKGQKITIFKNNGSQYVDTASLVNENIKTIYMFVKTDLNYDGRPDYLFHYKTGDDKFVYEYLDENLKPLFGEGKSAFKIAQLAGWLKFKIDANDRDESYESLRFLPYNVPGIGNVAAPIYMAEGVIPEIDQNPDPFERILTQRKRLYYFEPKITNEGAEFVNRVWMSYKTIDKVRKDLQLKVRDYLEFSFLLPQTPRDLNKVEVAVTWSRGVDLLYSKLVMDTQSFFKREYKILPIDAGGTNLVGHIARNAINLDSVVPTQGNLTLDTLYSFSRSRTAYIVNSEQAHLSESVEIMPENPKHKFPGRYFVRGYEKGSTTYTFLMTFENLIMKYQDGSVKKQIERPITKSSNLPTYSFGENIEALTAGVGGTKVPAIYVDATQINAQHIYVVTPRGDDLVVPLETNVQIPPGCISKNPVNWGNQGENAFSILCQDAKDKFSIRHALVK